MTDCSVFIFYSTTNETNKRAAGRKSAGERGNIKIPTEIGHTHLGLAPLCHIHFLEYNETTTAR
jgi:hypothetical protein